MNHAFLAFCAPGDHLGVCAAVSGAGLSVADIFFAERKTPPVPTHLLAIGPEGGAALSRWVEEHGLVGARGVGLVGVTAPLAKLSAQGHSLYQGIDPLEPLRAVAERARVPCGGCGGKGTKRSWGEMVPCALCSGEQLRLVVACAPDDGVCGVCGGRAIVSIGAPWGRADATCAACVSGKALSSFDVACELLGRRIPDRQASDGDGGLEVRVWHPDDAARLVEFALPFVVERLTR